MTDKVIENNQVTIMGEIVSGFSFSHEIFGEGFYMMDVRCCPSRCRVCNQIFRKDGSPPAADPQSPCPGAFS